MNSNWDTLRRAKNGDESSWRELLRRFQPRLKALAYLITGSVATAEDIAQETLIRAVEAEIRHRDGTLDGFLGTIAYRLALKEIREDNRISELAGLDPPDSHDMPLDCILKNEQEMILASTIRDLDTEHGEVLILRFYGNLGYDQIAGILGIPVGTVKSRVFYAIKFCRQKLREKGILE